MTEFTDIKIVDLDQDRTYNPDTSRLLYNVYFKLSTSPPPAWQEIFDAERRSQRHRHSMLRRAWIEGSYIVVHAPLEEIEEYHLPDLKEDVKNTNLKYREYLTQKAKLEAQQQVHQKQEQKKISSLRDNLRFDDNE